MRPPFRGIRVPVSRRVLVLLVIVAAGLAGAAVLLGARLLAPSAPKRPPPETPSADPAPAIDSVAFGQLRPRAGDHMAPPRIGFRWSFQPDSGGAEGVRYRVHIRGPETALEITRETEETQLTIDLAPSFPLGECEWWVEAMRPGGLPVRSPSERFQLAP